MVRAGDPVTIQLPSGETVDARVGALIDCGGQGCVFWLDGVDVFGRPVVVKWYNDYYATHFRAEQLQAIRDLLVLGSPSERFLWPLALATSAGDRSFGYVMEHRPDGYRELAKVVNTAMGEFRYDQLFTFLIQVADALQQLHTKGLAYRDINLSNFFVDTTTGSALVCDTDNIGFELRSYAGVRGKDGFMAPEIVANDAPPSANTDRHSLAVLIFILLVRWHPLEGARTVGLLDEASNRRFFGENPRFCFDPDDASNRPTRDHAAHYWSWYPASLRALFERAFTVGLHDPQHGRVMESEWLETLVELRDSMTSCTRCGGMNFLVPSSAPECRRPGCDGPLRVDDLDLAVRLGPGRTRRVRAAPGRRLYGYHLRRGYRDVEPVGRVVTHPDEPGALGLLNESTTTWQARFADGYTAAVGPGEGVDLEAGLELSAEQARLTIVSAR